MNLHVCLQVCLSAQSLKGLQEPPSRLDPIQPPTNRDAFKSEIECSEMRGATALEERTVVDR